MSRTILAATAQGGLLGSELASAGQPVTGVAVSNSRFTYSLPGQSVTTFVGR